MAAEVYSPVPTGTRLQTFVNYLGFGQPSAALVVCPAEALVADPPSDAAPYAAILRSVLLRRVVPWDDPATSEPKGLASDFRVYANGVCPSLEALVQQLRHGLAGTPLLSDIDAELRVAESVVGSEPCADGHAARLTHLTDAVAGAVFSFQTLSTGDARAAELAVLHGQVAAACGFLSDHDGDLAALPMSHFTHLFGTLFEAFLPAGNAVTDVPLVVSNAGLWSAPLRALWLACRIFVASEDADSSVDASSESDLRGALRAVLFAEVFATEANDDAPLLSPDAAGVELSMEPRGGDRLSSSHAAFVDACAAPVVAVWGLDVGSSDRLALFVAVVRGSAWSVLNAVCDAATAAQAVAPEGCGPSPPWLSTAVDDWLSAAPPQEGVAHPVWGKLCVAATASAEASLATDDPSSTAEHLVSLLVRSVTACAFAGAAHVQLSAVGTFLALPPFGALRYAVAAQFLTVAGREHFFRRAAAQGWDLSEHSQWISAVADTPGAQAAPPEASEWGPLLIGWLSCAVHIARRFHRALSAAPNSEDRSAAEAMLQRILSLPTAVSAHRDLLSELPPPVAVLLYLVASRCDLVVLVDDSSLPFARALLREAFDRFRTQSFCTAAIAPHLGTADALLCVVEAQRWLLDGASAHDFSDAIGQMTATAQALPSREAQIAFATEAGQAVLQALLHALAVAQHPTAYNDTGPRPGDRLRPALDLQGHASRVHVFVSAFVNAEAPVVLLVRELQERLHIATAIIKAEAATPAAGAVSPVAHLLRWVTADPVQLLRAAARYRDVNTARRVLQHLFIFAEDPAEDADTETARAVTDAFSTFQLERLAAPDASAATKASATSAAVATLGWDALLHAPASADIVALAARLQETDAVLPAASSLSSLLPPDAAADPDRPFTAADLTAALCSPLLSGPASLAALRTVDDAVGAVARSVATGAAFDPALLELFAEDFPHVWHRVPGCGDPAVDEPPPLRTALEYAVGVQQAVTLLLGDGYVRAGRRVRDLSLEELFVDGWVLAAPALCGDSGAADRLFAAVEDKTVLLKPLTLFSALCRTFFALCGPGGDLRGAGPEGTWLRVLHRLVVRFADPGLPGEADTPLLAGLVLLAHVTCVDATAHAELFDRWVAVARSRQPRLQHVVADAHARTAQRLAVEALEVEAASVLGSATGDATASTAEEALPLLFTLTPAKAHAVILRGLDAAVTALDRGFEGHATAAPLGLVRAAARAVVTTEPVLLRYPHDALPSSETDVATACSLVLLEACSAHDRDLDPTLRAALVAWLHRIPTAVGLRAVVLPDPSGPARLQRTSFRDASDRRFAACVPYPAQHTLVLATCGAAIGASSDPYDGVTRTALQSIKDCQQLHACALRAGRDLGLPIPFVTWTAVDLRAIHAAFVAASLFDDAFTFLAQCEAKCAPALRRDVGDLRVETHCAALRAQFDATAAAHGAVRAEMEAVRYVSQVARAEFGTKAAVAAVAAGAEKRTTTVRLVKALSCHEKPVLPEASTLRVAHKVLRLALESPVLSPLFVNDATWEGALIGVATLLAFDDAEFPDKVRRALTDAFPARSFAAHPLLIVENLLRCGRVHEAGVLFRRVPRLSCDDLLMTYAAHAASVASLTSAGDDCFPRGFSAATPAQPHPIGRFLKPIAVDLHPGDTAAHHAQMRAAFEYDAAPCVLLFEAIAGLCRDKRFVARTVFDAGLELYDAMVHHRDCVPLQVLMLDVCERCVSFGTACVGADDVTDDERKLKLLCEATRELFAANWAVTQPFAFYAVQRNVLLLIHDLRESSQSRAALAVSRACAGVLTPHFVQSMWATSLIHMVDLDLYGPARDTLLKLDAATRAEILPLVISRLEHNPVVVGPGIMPGGPRSVIHVNGTADVAAADEGPQDGTGLVVRSVKEEEIDGIVRQRREAIERFLEEFGSVEDRCGFAMRTGNIRNAVREAFAGDLPPEAWHGVIVAPAARTTQGARAVRLALLERDSTLHRQRPVLQAVAATMHQCGCEEQRYEWAVWYRDHYVAASAAVACYTAVPSGGAKRAQREAEAKQRREWLDRAQAQLVSAGFQPPDAAAEPVVEDGVSLPPCPLTPHELRDEGLRVRLASELLTALLPKEVPFDAFPVFGDGATVQASMTALLSHGEPLMALALKILASLHLDVVRACTAALASFTGQPKTSKALLAFLGALARAVVGTQLVTTELKNEALLRLVEAMVKLSKTHLCDDLVHHMTGDGPFRFRALVAVRKPQQALKEAIDKEDTALVRELLAHIEQRPPPYDKTVTRNLREGALSFLDVVSAI